MSLAFDQRLTTSTGIPDLLQTGKEAGLNIVVIFTSVPATIAALKRAGTLAESLDAKITLVVPQVVPYPLPLTSPPVQRNFQEKRFREIARESPVEIRVQLYLCRDEIESLEKVLRPHSLIVIGGRRRWWPTREKRLARKLRSSHDVILTETE